MKGNRVRFPFLFSQTMKYLIILLVSLFSFLSDTIGQREYDFSLACQQAYKDILHLKIQSGREQIARIKKQEPNNLIPYLLESYANFFELFFNENPTQYAAQLKKWDQLISLAKNGNTSSAFYHYAISMMYLHKAIIEIKFGDTWSAGWNFRRAYGYIRDNKSLHPGFTPNLLLHGSLETVAGTIPSGYRFFANLLGMKGSIQNGMKSIQQFLQTDNAYGKLMKEEAQFMYCYLSFYFENKKTEVIQYIQQQKLDVVNNHLFCFMLANLYQNSQQSSKVRTTIQKRNPSNAYLNTPVWSLLEGYAALNELDLDDAIASLTDFQNRFQGNTYLKESYWKLSWAYYLKKNLPAAEQARKMALQKGKTFTDADKKALKDAESGVWPNPILLQARVLNDGGFHQRALEKLQQMPRQSSPAWELEYQYRLGRIWDDMGKDSMALVHYNQTIQLGRYRKEYFAARAALQIGQLYEQKGQFKKALTYYELCLDMDHTEYKNSLDQRAKSGIARCRKQ